MFYLFQLSKIQASIKSKDFKQDGDSIEEGASYTFRDILQIGSSSSDVIELKEFSDWILNVGDRNIGENNDGEAEIEIPDDMLIKNSGDPIASIVNSTYPSLLENMSDISFFQDRAILAPTNDIVDSLNNYILSMIPGEKKNT